MCFDDLLAFLGWNVIFFIFTPFCDSLLSFAAEFKSFQTLFLAVYLTMVMSDWLQGPYVYALYSEYGFSKGDIGLLFIAGFGSSLLFGTVVGGFADRYGRKLNCLLFALLYGLSCITKHFNDFNILMIGRLLGGVATSILMSAFETWMIHEHRTVSSLTAWLYCPRLWKLSSNLRRAPSVPHTHLSSTTILQLSALLSRLQRGFSDEWLPFTFSHMTFGSGVVAIGAGVVAYLLAASFGSVAPFDASLVLLLAGGIVIALKWKENYGEHEASSSAAASSTQGAAGAFASFGKALRLLASSERVLLLGLIQSCFEGAMYVFVFMWTPALESSLRAAYAASSGIVESGDGDADAGSAASAPAAAAAPALPHGMVFAIFMVAVMIGSKAFEALIASRPVEHFLRWVFVAASLALATPVLTSSHTLQLAGFCVFEICCGIYFPSAVSASWSVSSRSAAASGSQLLRAPNMLLHDEQSPAPLSALLSYLLPFLLLHCRARCGLATSRRRFALP